VVFKWKNYARILRIQLIVNDVKQETSVAPQTKRPGGRRRGVWGWIAISLLLAVIVIAAAAEFMLH